MSWFDEQPQPQGTIGVQGGIPGSVGFLKGDESGPNGLPLAGQPWPGQVMPGQYEDIDLNGPKGPDYGTTVAADGSAWASTIAGSRQIAPPGTYDPATGKVRQPGAPALATDGGLQSTTGPQNGNYQQWFQNLMGGANDQASLLAHRAELEAAGWHISPANASGEITKVQQPDGQWVRVIGNGEGHPVYNIQPAQGGSVGSIGGMADGSLLTPWTEQFQPPAPFQAPDPSQIANDPNYQFQLQQGLQGVQRGAAANGTLLTGGTLKSLAGFGNGLASAFSDKQYNRAFGEYGQSYNNALGQYGLRKANFQENQDRPYTKLSGLASLGKPQTLQPPTG